MAIIRWKYSKESKIGGRGTELAELENYYCLSTQKGIQKRVDTGKVPTTGRDQKTWASELLFASERVE
jgi:hypothetical protein